MKITISLSLLILAGVILCPSVSAQKIDYDFAAGTDFSKYRTYKWKRAEKAQYPEKELDEMFLRTIEAELTKKGLVRTESEEADLFVTYQIAILEDMEWSTFQSSISWEGVPSGGSLPGFRGATTGSSYTIRKGSFILDLYDVKQQRQVWQAHATKTLSETTDLKKRTKNTEKVMAKIFKQYPPKSK